jgi:hypothetical protein
MGEFPNKATRFKSGEKAVQMGKKGGSVCSPAKRLANQIKAMNKWGITNEMLGKIDLLLSDPSISAADYYKHIARIEKDADPHDPVDAKMLMEYKERWHKMAHGDKSKQSMVNIQVNIDTDKKESIIKRLLDE